MYKKIILVILCISLCLPLSVFAEENTGADTVFELDFNKNELPSGSDVTFGDDGLIYAENGVLNFEASDTYPPVSTVLFPYDVSLDEYIYECGVTLNGKSSGNCWFSLCFGAVNSDILYQFTVKIDAGDEDGVSLLYKNGVSSWKTISSASISGFVGENGIDPLKFSGNTLNDGAELKLAVAVKDGMAFGCIDGVMVVEGSLPAARYGRTGISGRGVIILADNVKVSSKIPPEVTATDSFSSDLYVPDTGIIEAPTVIQRDRMTLPAYTSGKQRPAVIMATVKVSENKLHAYDGAVDLGELDTRKELFSGLVIPAFYVSDDTAAKMLSEFTEQRYVYDCFVIVSKAQLAENFKNNKYIRVVLDMSSRDRASYSDISGTLYSNGMKTVILSEAAANADMIYELHKRLITVWVSGTAGVESLLMSAVNGADAVVTSETTELLSMFEKVKETVVMRRQVVISDGGDGAAAYNNTLKAVLSALDSGVSAVRLCVRSTKDGEAVLHKDELTSDMSDSLLISDSTLTELKELTFNDKRMSSSDSITTLQELFEAVYKEYPDAVFHFDADDEKTLSSVTKLMKEYDMTYRCVILSDNAAVLRASAAGGIASAYTGGPYIEDGRSLILSLSYMCRTLNSYNSAYYAHAENMPEELISLMRSRGMGVYLTYVENGVIPATSGCSGFTVSTPSRTAKTALSLDASLDKDGRLSAVIKYRDGTELDVTALCSIITLSGSVKLSGGTVYGDGVFTVICPQTSDEKENYYVCSQTFSVVSLPEDDTQDAENEKQDENTLKIIIIAAASVAALIGFIVLWNLARKARKKDKNKPE